MTATYTAEEYEHLGELFTLDIEVEFTATPYDPGQSYGPPESCYPPEGGEIEDLQVLEVHATDAEGTIVADGTLDEIKARVIADVTTGGPLCEEIEEFLADLTPNPDDRDYED